MRVPIISVWDKDLKRSYVVGASRYDALYTDGRTIRYHNSQNGCTTGVTYEFIGEPIGFGEKIMRVEMVPVEQFLELVSESLGEEERQELMKELRKVAIQLVAKEEEETP